MKIGNSEKKVHFKILTIKVKPTLSRLKIIRKVGCAKLSNKHSENTFLFLSLVGKISLRKFSVVSRKIRVFLGRGHR